MTASPWPRPVPLVGDVTSAAERAGDPAAWAMPEHADGLYAVVAARRDVRRYRPDPVPDDVLQRVLAAGHAAPSVGHSQPWRFLVVRDAATRDRAAVLTDRERLRQAAQLEPDAARRLLDLQLEGVREAPLGVVVCCDRRTPAAGVLGRATFPDADLWSCAAAIQNLWLAARAEGLGMGWVTLFRPDELAALVGLPDGVVTLGWLCLGWPDERPPAPGLERAGWSRRLPLSAVVVEDRWPADDGGPAAPPSHLRAPGRDAVVGARDEADRLLTPPGSLGVLDRAVDRVVALGRGDATGGTLVLAAADHPVAALGVSAYGTRVTRDVARAALAGVSVGATAAAAAGLATVVVDAGVAGDPLDGAVAARPAGPRGDLAAAPALTRDDVARLLAAGRGLGAAHAGAGLVALGEVGVGNTTVAAALAAGLLGVDAAAVTGLGAGADSAVLERKRDVVAAALTRAGRGLGRDPAGALAELGGPELTVLAGVLLGAAEAGTAVVLDGFAVSVAALAAVLLEPGAQAALVAGQRSRERGHELVLQALGLEPLLDLRLRAGEGAGSALAAGLLLDGLRIRRGTARVG
ncbi:cob(II)yrinic acid a,c-diamide reductase [Geodermatophilus telluris]|uniref:Nicotinate-nucleotide--dimethylbenzimidazole phosphoribosyltransferase n=1 Tax=Geodermatophilus telluris TaxID=1190417 RepID=A0A1G6U3T6_9ACTN|nr:5,6-dimethylbenzimidazole synthase [Geodermatophilus telluris]SDD35215.1 cob(II)yrinic acid a,c-diamide reductase [Geodermatophilus telluris]